MKLRLWMAAVVLLGTTTSAMAFDEVIRLRGASTKGRVKQTTPSEIVIETNAVEEKVPVNAIQFVIYDGEPKTLAGIRRLIRSGNFEQAAGLLKDMDAGANANVKKDLQFYDALIKGKLALAGSFDLGTAKSLIAAYIKEYGTATYHYYPAFELFGQICVASQDFDQGAKAYAKVAEAPWPDFQLRAKVLTGKSLLGKGDADSVAKALVEFEAVAASRDASLGAELQRNMAKLGKAACLAKQGKGKDGIDLAIAVIRNNESNADDFTLLGTAYNSLGDCYRTSGKSKEALYAYLYTDLMYNANKEAHAEALYHLARLWKEQNQVARANEARAKLRSIYRTSVWAQMDVKSPN